MSFISNALFKRKLPKSNITIIFISKVTREFERTVIIQRMASTAWCGRTFRRIVVANVLDRFSDDLLIIDFKLWTDLTEQHNHPGLWRRLWSAAYPQAFIANYRQSSLINSTTIASIFHCWLCFVFLLCFYVLLFSFYGYYLINICCCCCCYQFERCQSWKAQLVYRNG